MDTAAVISDLYPALNSADGTDLQFWTADQLFAWLSDALQTLDGAAPLFAGVQQLTTSSAEIALTPAGTIAVVACAWNGASLRPATVAELEALDPAWETATGTPKRWTADTGPGSLRLYPAPAAAGDLIIVHHGSAPRFGSAGGAVELPAALSEFLYFSVLASARRQTGEAWLPDVSAIAQAQADMLAQAAKGYYGSAL